jgi:hypothetical protein
MNFKKPPHKLRVVFLYLSNDIAKLCYKTYTFFGTFQKMPRHYY